MKKIIVEKSPEENVISFFDKYLGSSEYSKESVLDILRMLIRVLPVSKKKQIFEKLMRCQFYDEKIQIHQRSTVRHSMQHKFSLSKEQANLNCKLCEKIANLNIE